MLKTKLMDDSQKETYLQVLTHLFGDSTQTDGGKVVDSEARVLGVVHGEHRTARYLHLGVLEPLGDCLQTHAFSDFIEEDFDEDTRARCRIFLGKLDAVEDGP